MRRFAMTCGIAYSLYPYCVLQPVELDPSPCFSFSLASFSFVSAFRMPLHASRSTRSSCNPRPPVSVSAASVSVVELFGKPTPREGGMNPGGGAFMAEGAMREWRMCARDERMAIWIDCECGVFRKKLIEWKDCNVRPDGRNTRSLRAQTVLTARHPGGVRRLVHQFVAE